MTDTWRTGGRPRGVGGVGPEVLVGREGAELGGRGRGGGEGGTVEAREDVGLDYVWVDGGDCGSAADVVGGERLGLTGIASHSEILLLLGLEIASKCSLKLGDWCLLYTLSGDEYDR